MNNILNETIKALMGESAPKSNNEDSIRATINDTEFLNTINVTPAKVIDQVKIAEKDFKDISQYVHNYKGTFGELYTELKGWNLLDEDVDQIVDNLFDCYYNCLLITVKVNYGKLSVSPNNVYVFPKDITFSDSEELFQLDFDKDIDYSQFKDVIEESKNIVESNDHDTDEIVKKFVAPDNLGVEIIKAPNGKYFNRYYSDINDAHYNATSGPFKSVKDAEKMVHKHRPTVKEIKLESASCDKIELKKEDYIDEITYHFTIVLYTSDPNSNEFKKLTHHIENLIDFNALDFDMSVYGVSVEPESDSVLVKGEATIDFYDGELDSTEIADYITDSIDVDGWEDLDVEVGSVSVQAPMEEAKTIHKPQSEEEKTYNMVKQNYGKKAADEWYQFNLVTRDSDKTYKGKKVETTSDEYKVNEKYKNMFVDYCKDKILTQFDKNTVLTLIDIDGEEIVLNDGYDLYQYEKDTYNVMVDNDTEYIISAIADNENKYQVIKNVYPTETFAQLTAKLDWIGIGSETYNITLELWIDGSSVTEELNSAFEELYGDKIVKTEDLSVEEENNLADEIYKYLIDNQFFPTDVFAADTRVMVDISWGDWKHDHQYCDNLMKAKGYTLVEEEVTEEDGSDCYSAIRHYEPTGKFDNVNIDESKKVKTESVNTEDVDKMNLDYIKDILQKSGIKNERTLDLMSKDVLKDLKNNYADDCKTEAGLYYGAVITDAIQNKIAQITGKRPDIKFNENKKVTEAPEKDSEEYTRLCDEIRYQAEDNSFTLTEDDIRGIADKMIADKFFFNHDIFADDNDDQAWEEINSLIIAAIEAYPNKVEEGIASDIGEKCNYEKITEDIDESSEIKYFTDMCLFCETVDDFNYDSKNDTIGVSVWDVDIYGMFPGFYDDDEVNEYFKIKPIEKNPNEFDFEIEFIADGEGDCYNKGHINITNPQDKLYIMNKINFWFTKYLGKSIIEYYREQKAKQ